MSPVACPSASGSGPGRRQAVEAGAIAAPRRGFGLDCLPPARSGALQQTRTYYGRRRAPITDAEEAARCRHDPSRTTFGLEPAEIRLERGLDRVRIDHHRRLRHGTPCDPSAGRDRDAHGLGIVGATLVTVGVTDVVAMIASPLQRINLKLWKTSTGVEDDLRELWLHEMRQIQRLSAYKGAREVIVEVVDLVEDETNHYQTD